MALERIVIGGQYRYAAAEPKGCRGKRYRVVRMVVAVPSYQEQVLVEALTGPDAGLWFCCSPWNFSTRFEEIPPEEPREEEVVIEVSPPKVAGKIFADKFA